MKKTNTTLFILITLLTIFYLVFRASFTIPIHLGILSLIFGILLLFIELWEAIDFTIYSKNFLLKEKQIPVLPVIKDTDYPEIDIFIATYNESIDILKETIDSCKNLNYPNKSLLHIYLCDDGNRKECNDLAKKSDINYITRKKRVNFKAGNYNNALTLTNSPYVVTFDADMSPEPNFLLETIPYFVNNTNLGFLQLPQNFKNPDIFQYRFNLENKIPYEQNYFFNNIQLARNENNSVICCGTNVIYNRTALNSINGFAVKTITEDIATGMLIQDKGYDTIALNNNSAYGHSVLDFDGFIKQRSRWATGCMQMIKNYNFFTFKGLNFNQKLDYFSCILHWLSNIKRIFYLILPLLFILFSIIVIDCNITTFLIIWLPIYILKLLFITLAYKKENSYIWNNIREVILSPILSIKLLSNIFIKKPLNFEVSPKEFKNKKITNMNIKLLCIHCAFLLLNITALVICIIKICSGALLLTYLLSLIWIVINTFYLLIAIKFDINNTNKEVINTKNNNVTKYELKNYFK